MGVPITILARVTFDDLRFWEFEFYEGKCGLTEDLKQTVLNQKTGHLFKNHSLKSNARNGGGAGDNNSAQNKYPYSN